MKLEPQGNDTDIRNGRGTARVLAGVVIVILATLCILAVMGVLPQSVVTALAGKAALIAGICAVSVVAIWLLARR